MALNTVVLMGRITADPELRSTQNGISVTSFTLAVDKPYNKENQHPEANFIDCTAWRNTAEFVTKYFSKGSRMIVEGSLQTRGYEDKEGKKRKATEVVVDNVNFVDKKSDGGNYNYSAPSNEDFADVDVNEEEPPF